MNTGLSFLSQLQRALQQNPSNPEHHYQLALMQEAEGETEAALTSLRQATALHPTYLPALLRLGQIYARHGLPFHAFSFLDQAQRLQPDTPVDPSALSRSAWRCGLFAPFQAWIERWGKQIYPPALQQETLRYWLDLLSCQTSSQESWLEQELQALYPQSQENSVPPPAHRNPAPLLSAQPGDSAAPFQSCFTDLPQPPSRVARCDSAARGLSRNWLLGPPPLSFCSHPRTMGNTVTANFLPAPVYLFP